MQRTGPDSDKLRMIGMCVREPKLELLTDEGQREDQDSGMCLPPKRSNYSGVIR